MRRYGCNLRLEFSYLSGKLCFLGLSLTMITTLEGRETGTSCRTGLLPTYLKAGLHYRRLLGRAVLVGSRSNFGQTECFCRLNSHFNYSSIASMILSIVPPFLQISTILRHAVCRRFRHSCTVLSRLEKSDIISRSCLVEKELAPRRGITVSLIDENLQISRRRGRCRVL